MISRRLTLLSITLLSISLFFSIFSVKAYAIDVTCQSSGCTKSSNDPLFSEENLSPLWSGGNSIKAINNFPESRTFAILLSNQSFFDLFPNPLEEKIKITIVEQESGNTLWGPETLAVFKNTGTIQLSSIPSGSDKTYLINVDLDDVGNEYQGKRVSFDLTVGFETHEDQEEEEDGDDDSDGDDEDRDSDEEGDGGDNPIGGGDIQGTATFGLLALPYPATTQPIDEGTPDEPGIIFPVEELPEVAGTSSSCIDPWYWWLFYILQGAISSFLLLTHKNRGNNRINKYFFIQVINTAIFTFIYWKFFCPWWDMYLSLTIGVIYILLHILIKHGHK